jgi:hypothetical protein
MLNRFLIIFLSYCLIIKAVMHGTYGAACPVGLDKKKLVHVLVKLKNTCGEKIGSLSPTTEGTSGEQASERAMRKMFAKSS